MPEPRRIRDTSLYDASVTLYAVLFGLILLKPLEALALDVARHPWDGNWEIRFLALGLLVEGTRWLHAMIAALRWSEIARFYAVMWFLARSICILVLFAVMVAALRDLRTLLIVYAVYVWLELLSEASEIRRLKKEMTHHWESELRSDETDVKERNKVKKEKWKEVRRNAVLLPRVYRTLLRSRKILATEADIQSLVPEVGPVGEMWVYFSAFYIWLDLEAFLLVAVLFAVSATWPDAGPWVALAWAANVAFYVMLDYYLTPQYFSV